MTFSAGFLPPIMILDLATGAEQAAVEKPTAIEGPVLSRAQQVLDAYNDQADRSRAWARFYAKEARCICFRLERGLLLYFEDTSTLTLRDNDDALLLSGKHDLDELSAFFETSILY